MCSEDRALSDVIAKAGDDFGEGVVIIAPCQVLDDYDAAMLEAAEVDVDAAVILGDSARDERELVFLDAIDSVVEENIRLGLAETLHH